MRSAICILLALGILAGGRAHASPVDERARAIFHDYMSPYCPELLLADCSSRPAATLRREIREMLEAGTSEDEVCAALERRFGERLRAAPPGHGFGLVAWLAPYVTLVLVSAAVVVWWRRRTRASPPPAVSTAAVDPALRARFEAELRRF